MWTKFIIFLCLNFLALALGSIFTSKGVSSDWYQGLDKAPWTPPGWVFGAAWTTIMVCFAIYMAAAYQAVNGKGMLITLYVLQLVFNIAFNPLFFQFQFALLALISIVLLFVVLLIMTFLYFPQLKLWTLWLVPYLVWLAIAVSLNAYIVLKN